MNISDDSTVAAIGGVVAAFAAGGWAILGTITSGMERRHELISEMIRERFEHAEDQRRESSEQWRNLFHEIQRRHEQHSTRLSTIEQRLVALEHPHRP